MVVIYVDLLVSCPDRTSAAWPVCRAGEDKKSKMDPRSTRSNYRNLGPDRCMPSPLKVRRALPLFLSPSSHCSVHRSVSPGSLRGSVLDCRERKTDDTDLGNVGELSKRMYSVVMPRYWTWPTYEPVPCPALSAYSKMLTLPEDAIQCTATKIRSLTPSVVVLCYFDTHIVGLSPLFSPRSHARSWTPGLFRSVLQVEG